MGYDRTKHKSEGFYLIDLNDFTWEKKPQEGQRVIVSYGNSTSDMVWYENDKFVNKDGLEMYNIFAWKPYTN